MPDTVHPISRKAGHKPDTSPTRVMVARSVEGTRQLEVVNAFANAFGGTATHVVVRATSSGASPGPGMTDPRTLSLGDWLRIAAVDLAVTGAPRALVEAVWLASEHSVGPAGKLTRRRLQASRSVTPSR